MSELTAPPAPPVPPLLDDGMVAPLLATAPPPPPAPTMTPPLLLLELPLAPEVGLPASELGTQTPATQEAPPGQGNSPPWHGLRHWPLEQMRPPEQGFG